MKVLIYLDSSGFGGIESHVSALATGLHHRGIDVAIVFHKIYGPHPLLHQCRAWGVRVIEAGSFTGLTRLLVAEQPDILHSHGYKANILARLACLSCGGLAGLRHVASYHAGDMGAGRVRLYTWLDEKTAFLSAKAIAVSKAIRARLNGGSHYLPNFIDLPDHPQSRGTQIAFVGRLSPEKAPDRFIAMAQALPDQDFHLYGDGPMRNSLEQQAPHNVTFHGAVPDMNPVWSRVAMLVMPSRNEGLPMAALEAMARGIPVIATPVGDVPSLVIDGQTGYLVRDISGPGLAALAGLIARQGDPAKHRMALAVQQHIRTRFGADQGIARMVALYQACRSRPVTARA